MPSDIENIGQFLGRWFATRRTAGITFRETSTPIHDPNAEYEVVYEAIFEPNALDQLRLEIWATAQGDLAIGLETRERVARRLRGKYQSKRFVAGHEPVSIPESGLLKLLDVVATGRLSISAVSIPFLGLVSTRAIAPDDVIRELSDSGYTHAGWVHRQDRFGRWIGAQVLPYRAW